MGADDGRGVGGLADAARHAGLISVALGRRDGRRHARISLDPAAVIGHAEQVHGEPEQLASEAVAHLLGRPSTFDAYSRLESAEVVLLAGAAGIAMTWTQDDVEGARRRFGLLMTVEELQHAPHGVPTPAGFTYPFQSWLADLELAVVEPHVGDASGGRRTWFRTLP